MTKQEEDGTVSYEGFCIDLFKELAKVLNVTYEMYLSPDGQYGGKTENDTWNGMMGELVNRVSTLHDISLVRLDNVTQCVLSVLIKSCCRHHYQRIHMLRGSNYHRKTFTKGTFWALFLRQSESLKSAALET